VKKIITIALFITQIIYAGEIELNSDINCAFDDRVVRIELSKRLSINGGTALKADFFHKADSLGSCLLKISDEFPRGNGKAAFNQIYFEKFSCNFSSDKRGENIAVTTRGVINYSSVGSGPFYVDLFHNKPVLQCYRKNE
jgi:hypothetical protein